jgi:eukaryotic-like serine/threonine-protein kinase
VFFAMGFVSGESLAERIARERVLPVADVVRVMGELADALGYAHERGVVHRDVKAENVLLDGQTGRAMVTDFGIARVAETQPLTATGTVLGTVHYMSPEQVTGDALDGRSDLYALGVLAFLALTGRFPFERASASAVVVAQVNSPPPRLRDVLPNASAAFEALIATLLAKAPGERYPNAAALRRALDDPALLASSAPPAESDVTAVLSSSEAQQVWSRAAELQANTGMITPPPSFTPRGDEELVTRGYDAALVKQSAVEAGIEPRYVERALQERSQMERVALTELVPGELMQRKPNAFLGSRTKLEYTASFDGELTGEDFEEIADEVRRALGEIVNVSSVGRTLTVNTAIASGRQAGVTRALQLHLASRNGRTQARIYEDLTNTATQWFVGLGVGGGVSVSMMIGGITAALTHSPPLVVGAALSWAALSYAVARLMLGRTSRKRDAQLQDLMKRVVERARRTLDDRSAAPRIGAR